MSGKTRDRTPSKAGEKSGRPRGAAPPRSQEPAAGGPGGATRKQATGEPAGGGASDQDARLLKQCDVEFFVASGPGGQHRNRTASGVRIRHRPSGIVVTATERRSQRRNREAALERLKEKLAARRKRKKKRVATRPSKAAKKRRLESKRHTARKKEGRSRPRGGEE